MVGNPATTGAILGESSPWACDRGPGDWHGGRSGGGAKRRAGGERQTGAVGEPAARLADQPEHGLAGVTHDLAEAVEEDEAQPLGPGGVQLRRQSDALEPESRLWSSTLSLNQAALAPNFWLGSASAASSLVST